MSGKRRPTDTGSIMALAGVVPGRRFRRLGLVALLSLLVAAGCIWAWAVLVPARPTESAVEPSEEEGVLQEEVEKTTGPVGKNADRRRRPRRSRDRQPSVAERRLSTFYAESNRTETVPQGSRVPPPLEVQNTTAFGGASSVALDDPKAVSARAEIAAPAAQRIKTTFLSADAIRRVLERNGPTIRARLERLLERDPSLAGKITIFARVRPDGSVERVRVEPARYQGTSVAEIIGREVKAWRFPAFEGNIHEVDFPLVLAAGGGR